MEVQVDLAPVYPVAHLERGCRERGEHRPLHLLEHELARSLPLLEGPGVVLVQALHYRRVQLAERRELSIAQLGDDRGRDLPHAALHARLLLGLRHAGRHDGAHVVAPQRLVGLVEHDLALLGMLGHARLEIVADQAHGDPSEELVGPDMAEQPCVLPHVQGCLDVCILRVRENRDEQAHLRDLSRDGVDQPHGRPRPVHLHGLSGLVVEVVRDVLGDGVVGVSPREGDVAHRCLAALGAFVAVLLPQELQVDADFAQLAVDVSVVRPRHGLLRLPFLGEQHRRDLVVAQQGDVPPPDALLGRPVQHLLYRMRRDVPRACDLPSGHVLRAQLDDELRIAVLCHGEPSFLDLVGNASRV